MAGEKNDCNVKVWLSEPLELELRRLAEADGRRLSDYIRFVLQRHVYGHCARATDEAEAPPRGD